MSGDAFTSFNARAVPAQVVARTFIAPSQYEVLTRIAHTIVVGPRGSGKTTLLKMLTPEALTDPLAQKGIANLPAVGFTGVFIPTDINWSSQLGSYRDLNLPESHSAALVRASFTTAVFRAFITAIQQRVSAPDDTPLLEVGRLRFDAGQEATLVQLLAEAWRVNPRIGSMLGLRAALSQRLVHIAEFALAEERLGSDGRDGRFASSPHLDLPLLPSLTAALDILEAVKPDLGPERWALLFDELELAPQEIRSELLLALRSVDDRFLFKLSLSPFSAEFAQLTTALSAMPGHDHDEVSLSYGRKEDGITFSLALMEAIVARHVDRHCLEPVTLPSLLGAPDFPSEYGWTSDREPPRVTRAFSKLYHDDQTFRRYAQRHGGDLEGYLSLEGDKRAQVVRKVAPIVIVRAAFRNPDTASTTQARRFKTRKNADIYRGYTSIATLLEGNPRYIIGVMNGLLADRRDGPIGGPRQTAEIQRTAGRFRALLTTIPGPPSMRGDRRALLGIIDLIGDYFRQSVIADDFTPDPVGSFIVDSTANPELLEAIGQMVNQGAMVYVPDAESGPVMTSVRGKRFRLNYLLASQFGLPLRLERAVALSRILSNPRAGESKTEQGSLFWDSDGMA